MLDAAMLDAAMPDAAMPDAAMLIDAAMLPDAIVSACGLAPTGNWRGTSRYQNNGSSGYEYAEAEVTWTLASTAGCVDTFRATGMVRYGFDHSGGSSENQVVVSPGDGTLTIDRTGAVATYTMDGATGAAGLWAEQRGAFDGKLFAGWISHQKMYRWQFARVDAVFTPPGTGCSEPATDQWTSRIRNDNFRSHADATWTRTSTTGCVDTFVPSGTAHKESTAATDSTLTYDPDHAPIKASDGALVIDRSTSPPTFEIERGTSVWPAQLTYTYPDGSVRRVDGDAIAIWVGSFRGSYDGDNFAAYVPDGSGWTFARTP